jgi:hypothetical protein
VVGMNSAPLMVVGMDFFDPDFRAR